MGKEGSTSGISARKSAFPFICHAHMTAILRYARSTTQFAIFKVPFLGPVCMCCKIVVYLHVKEKEIQFGANFLFERIIYCNDSA